MSRLIDADKLNEALSKTCLKSLGLNVDNIVRLQPTVEAVPLEPLCKWLAGYAAPPNYALDEVRDDSIDPESLVYTANDGVKAWEFHFRELLKSGLMETEGEDA